MIYTNDEIYKVIGEAAPETSTTSISPILHAALIDTPIGTMITLADDISLYLLEFFTKKKLYREVMRLRQQGFHIDLGATPVLKMIKTELKAYFEGTLTEFKTPYTLLGSEFQKTAWQALCQIPYGQTRSYAEQSQSLGKAKAYRAVGNANGANVLSIIVPCHRVIASDGSLGGYGGGVEIKRWLLAHEKQGGRG